MGNYKINTRTGKFDLVGNTEELEDDLKGLQDGLNKTVSVTDTLYSYLPIGVRMTKDKYDSAEFNANIIAQDLAEGRNEFDLCGSSFYVKAQVWELNQSLTIKNGKLIFISSSSQTTTSNDVTCGFRVADDYRISIVCENITVEAQVKTSLFFQNSFYHQIENISINNCSFFGEIEVLNISFPEPAHLSQAVGIKSFRFCNNVLSGTLDYRTSYNRFITLTNVVFYDNCIIANNSISSYICFFDSYVMIHRWDKINSMEILIENNFFDSDKPTNGELQYAVRTRATKTVFRNNHIKRCNNHAIWCSDKEVVIEGNTIENMSTTNFSEIFKYDAVNAIKAEGMGSFGTETLIIRNNVITGNNNAQILTNGIGYNAFKKFVFDGNKLYFKGKQLYARLYAETMSVNGNFFECDILVSTSNDYLKYPYAIFEYRATTNNNGTVTFTHNHLVCTDDNEHAKFGNVTFLQIGHIANATIQNITLQYNTLENTCGSCESCTRAPVLGHPNITYYVEKDNTYINVNKHLIYHYCLYKKENCIEERELYNFFESDTNCVSRKKLDFGNGKCKITDKINVNKLIFPNVGAYLDGILWSTPTEEKTLKIEVKKTYKGATQTNTILLNYWDYGAQYSTDFGENWVSIPQANGSVIEPLFEFCKAVFHLIPKKSDSEIFFDVAFNATGLNREDITCDRNTFIEISYENWDNPPKL